MTSGRVFSILGDGEREGITFLRWLDHIAALLGWVSSLLRKDCQDVWSMRRERYHIVSHETEVTTIVVVPTGESARPRPISGTQIYDNRRLQ